jgi:hypothetical protein
MESKTWYTVDKITWGTGPWQNEPDKEQWADEATGLPCLLVRNSAGALCGYVGVGPDHPWHGLGWYDRALGDLRVHGTVNYADACQEGPEGITICHVPGPGEPENVWWLGFDCDHGFDIAPGREAREAAAMMPPLRLPSAEYRDVAYVKAECARLAAQVHAAA